MLVWLLFLGAVHFLNAQSHVLIKQYFDAKKTTIQEQYFVLKSAPKILDSTYISYYANGLVKSEGTYKKNLKVGVWKFYYENGELRTKGNYLSGMDYGVWTYFYENGNTSAEGSINKGIKEGNWKTYYESGGVKNEGNYLKGKKDGLWQYFNESGGLKARANYKDDIGLYTELFATDEVKAEGIIENGKSNGLWKYYYEDGSLKAEGEEREGLKEGLWKYYYPDSTVMSEGIFKKGSEEGNWKYYHENGTVSSEGVAKQGQKDGYWKLYYKNGLQKGEGNFTLGNGIYKEYYESGKLKSEGNISNEKNQGLWKYYYEDGILEGKCLFERGEGHYVGYYEDGKIKMEGDIVDGNKTGVWKLYNEDGTLAGLYRNYYENNTEKFALANIANADTQKEKRIDTNFAIQKIKIRRKKSRFFAAKTNEFRTIILAANPLGAIVYRLPVSVEYYFQERLGFEIGCQYYREPFFTTIKNIPLEDPFYSGLSVHFRQKFYQKDQDIGMFYFGYELRYTQNVHSVKYLDTMLVNDPVVKRPFIKQSIYEVSLIIGNRIMRDAKSPGITIDMFMGIGLGYRTFTNSWQGEIPRYNALFKNTPLSKVTVPIRFGIMIGYALGKNNRPK